MGTTYRDEHAAGFTLTEVMVVILIIGILLGFGVPTYLGVRNRAHDTAARTNLDAAAGSAAVLSGFGADVAAVNATSMAEAEPTLIYVSGGQPSTGPEEVSIDSSQSDRLIMTVQSQSGTCIATELTEHGSSTYESTSCSAALAADVDAPLEDIEPTNIAALSTPSHTCCYNGDANPASNMVDGSLSTFNHAAWGGKQSAAFQFEASATIEEIRIWNRADCCSSRMRDLVIVVSDAPISTDRNTALASGAARFNLSGTVGSPSTVSVGVTGRYVRIFNSGMTFHVQEVEIMGRTP